MKAETLKQLDHINQEFYQNYSRSFSQTRGKLQHGVQTLLEQIHRTGNWLDVGCGNGNLAHAWVERGLSGLFCGLDFSSGLISDAKRLIPPLVEGQKIIFRQADLTKANWTADLPEVQWDGVFCFAVLHHIPGQVRRAFLCSQLRKLLPEGGICRISVWQPRNSPRLVKRIQPWESVGLSSEHVESGDVLMDWRAHQTSKNDSPALRFVHIFTADELSELAISSGFSVGETYYSDGKEGNLGLYQKWVANF
ncbi:MAG: class I SAM-dependent methyltransferase [Pelolinea sp.]|nr:class I SAM-dependent methyltransferase [Pelolinea sp.]